MVPVQITHPRPALGHKLMVVVALTLTVSLFFASSRFVPALSQLQRPTSNLPFRRQSVRASEVFRIEAGFPDDGRTSNFSSSSSSSSRGVAES